MTFAIPNDMLHLQQAAAELARVMPCSDITRVQQEYDDQRRILKEAETFNSVDQIVKAIDENRKTVWQSIHRARQRTLEELDRLHQAMEILSRLRHQATSVANERPVLRNKEGAAGNGKKSAAKKSAKSSGGDGGGGGGDSDGDGPQRTRSKKRRPYQNRSTTSEHPPSIPTGESTSPQSPSPQSPSPLPRQRRDPITYLSLLGALYIAVTAQNEEMGIIVFAIIALCVTGHSDVAKTALTSKAMTNLIARWSGKGGDK